MRENRFQSKLISELRELYPNAIITKLDPTFYQGMPDLLILEKDKWATLECKASKKAKKQPNQPLMVDKMNNMSFSAFIYPENKEEVLHDLQRALSS